MRARTHTQVRLEHRLEKQTKLEFELLDLKYKARVAIEALCTHDFLREGKKSITREKKPGSSSAWALIHLDDVEKQHYATLIGRAHDPQLKGRPTGYRFKVRNARVAVGAGYVYPLAGSILTMPGLGKVPGGTKIDIDGEGNVVGMF